MPSAALKKITAGGDGRGIVMYDPGYTNTAPVKSAISYIDGDKGVLRYRGIPIEELAENSNYIETAYLLLYGELPSVEQLRGFSDAVARHSSVSSAVIDAVSSLPVASACSALLSTPPIPRSTIAEFMTPASFSMRDAFTVSSNPAPFFIRLRTTSSPLSKPM